MINSKTIITAGSIAGFTGCIGDFWMTYLLADYQPGYSHLRQTMSMLGVSNSPVSTIISAWWVVLGFLMILFAIAFAKAFDYHLGAVKISTWLIILYGLGEGLGSGLFKAERLHHSLTLTGNIHEVMGAVGTISILILPLFMMKIVPQPANPGFHTFSWIVFLTALILLVMFVFRFTSYHIEGLFMYKGLWQRLFVMDCYIYLIVIGVIMIRKQHTPLKTS